MVLDTKSQPNHTTKGRMKTKTTSNHKTSTLKCTKEILQVCDSCGIEARRLTYLKRFGREPGLQKMTISTYHTGICDVCKLNKSVTEPRDFFYPDFDLITKEINRLSKEAIKKAEEMTEGDTIKLPVPTITH